MRRPWPTRGCGATEKKNYSSANYIEVAAGIFFSSSCVISNHSTRLIYELMCWLSLVVRSPPARRSLSWIQSLLIDLWLLVIEVSTLSLILQSKSTNYPDHGHHGDPPPTRKIPMVEPGIEPGISWLVVRSSDHQTTRLVCSGYKILFF